jgi:hypothetical protein
MGEFTFPEFRRRISSHGWSVSGSPCEESTLNEVNQVVKELGGVKSIEQSYCNQEVSQNDTPNQRRGFLSVFSSLGTNQINKPRCVSISETVASQEFTADANISKQFGKSAPEK